MLLNKLKLNDQKTEFIIFGQPSKLKKTSTTCIKVGIHSIEPSKSIRNIGAFMDTQLTMEEQHDQKASHSSPFSSNDVSSTTGTTLQQANIHSGRKWDKKHACPYCMQLYAKLPRRRKQKQSQEIDVIAAFSLPSQSIQPWMNCETKGTLPTILRY